jgi:hypothetical protein
MVLIITAIATSPRCALCSCFYLLLAISSSQAFNIANTVSCYELKANS